MGFVILAYMKKVLFFILIFPSCFIVKHNNIEQEIISHKVDFHCGSTEKLNVIKNQKELDEFIIGKGINGCRNLRNQNIIQDINGTPKFGGTISTIVNNSGDLLKSMYIELTLPDLNKPNNISPPPRKLNP